MYSNCRSIAGRKFLSKRHYEQKKVLREWSFETKIMQKAQMWHQRCHTRIRRGPTRDATSDAVARASVCVCVFFFLGFAPTRLDSCRIGFDSSRTELIRPKQAQNGRNRVKSALNMAGKAETCLLLSFFVNQGIVMCFLRIF